MTLHVGAPSLSKTPGSTTELSIKEILCIFCLASLINFVTSVCSVFSYIIDAKHVSGRLCPKM